MTFKIKGISFSTAILVCIWISYGCMASNPSEESNEPQHVGADALSQDQLTSSHHYRPYYYYHRRPIYPTYYNGKIWRPVYPNYYLPYSSSNQYPISYPVASPGNNLRPITTRPFVYPAAVPSQNRPVSTGPATSSCNSTEAASQQGGICWDSPSQILRISSNLTIETFVAFWVKRSTTTEMQNKSFQKQICEQSRRFNSVGVLCVQTREDDCLLNGTASAIQCMGSDCACVVGERYQDIAAYIRKHAV